jgi:hypothetical protein
MNEFTESGLTHCVACGEELGDDNHHCSPTRISKRDSIMRNGRDHNSRRRCVGHRLEIGELILGLMEAD